MSAFKWFCLEHGGVWIRPEHIVALSEDVRPDSPDKVIIHLSSGHSFVIDDERTAEDFVADLGGDDL